MVLFHKLCLLTEYREEGVFGHVYIDSFELLKVVDSYRRFTAVNKCGNVSQIGGLL